MIGYAARDFDGAGAVVNLYVNIKETAIILNKNNFISREERAARSITLFGE